MRAVISAIDVVTPDITTIHFKPEQPFNYIAGQFIELSLPHDSPDNRGERRWFTLSSSPTEPLLAITTRYSQPSSSFKSALRKLVVGDTLQLSEPMGDFVLPKDTGIQLVFAAAGLGVTPFRSMVQWLIDSGEQRQLQIVLAAKTEQDIVFLDEFNALGLAPTICLVEPPDSWPGLVGHLTAELIVAATGDPTGKRFYTSGPEPMVEAIEKQFAGHGITPDQLISDFFPGYDLI